MLFQLDFVFNTLKCDFLQALHAFVLCFQTPVCQRAPLDAATFGRSIVTYEYCPLLLLQLIKYSFSPDQLV